MDAATTEMPNDSSSSQTLSQPPLSPLSPAQAIAEAWKRESADNQEKWRRVDAEVKVKFDGARKSVRKGKM